MVEFIGNITPYFFNFQVFPSFPTLRGRKLASPIHSTEKQHLNCTYFSKVLFELYVLIRVIRVAKIHKSLPSVKFLSYDRITERFYLKSFLNVIHNCPIKVSIYVENCHVVVVCKTCGRCELETIRVIRKQTKLRDGWQIQLSSVNYFILLSFLCDTYALSYSLLDNKQLQVSCWLF